MDDSVLVRTKCKNTSILAKFQREWFTFSSFKIIFIISQHLSIPATHTTQKGRGPPWHAGTLSILSTQGSLF